VSLRATGAWELPVLWDAWTAGGTDEVLALLETAPGWAGATEGAVSGAAASRSSRPVLVRPPVTEFGGGIAVETDHEAVSGLPVGDRARAGFSGGDGQRRAGGMGGGPGYRRVFVDYATGYRQSPYADVGTPGEHTRDTRRMAAAERSSERADQRQSRRADPPRKLWHASPGSSGR
jgi:error-prone DNA polymerase